MRTLLQALLKKLYRVRIAGNLPEALPARTVYVANHQTFLDGLFVSLVVPRDALFIVHTSVVANPLFRSVLRMVPHLAIDTASPLALKGVIRLIEKGQPIVIFPEGRLTATGQLMKVYDGAAFLAAKTGATVIPITVQGALATPFSRVTHFFKKRMFPQVDLMIHPVASVPLPESGSAREKRRAASNAMRDVLMASLINAEPARTLYQALLHAMRLRGPKAPVVEDIQFKTDAKTGQEAHFFEEVSYQGLLKRVLGIRQLLERYTEVGERVGVLLPNATGAVAAVLGLSAGGRVPAMLNYTAGLEGMKSALVAAQIKTILTSKAFVAKAGLEALVGQLENVRLLYAEDLRKELTWKDKMQVACWLRRPAQAEVPRLPTDPAVVLFTSGSENRPKGVVHSHRSLLANVAQIRTMADFTPHDKFMTALPMFHSFGLTAGTLLPVLMGMRVFLHPNPLRYRELPELIYDRGCTVLLGSPTFLAGYARFAHPYDFYQLRYVIAGAEKLAEPVRKTWLDKFGIRILEGYGATECAPVISVNTPMASKIASVGRLVPGMTAVLEPAEGVEKGGVLHVSGPNVMLGYLRYEAPGVIEPPSSSQGQGWYSTGDIVSIDPQGYISIEGRLKRFAKVGGEMVALDAVERMVQAATPKGMHAVVPRTDASKGESLVLFTTQADLARDQLLKACREAGLPELYVPRKIVVLDKLPMLGALKVDYVTLKKRAEE